jgi:hypothetical protein
MNLAGKPILVCGGRDFTDYPLLCGTIDAGFRRWCYGRQSRHSRRGTPVPIVEEALLAPPAGGPAKGTTLC